MIHENNFPIILSNIPSGEDHFEYKSHDRIAKSIISVITNQSEIIDKQIVGLEGNWGSGKSNIIKMIENQIGEKYIHFNYDTWTHQEDLTKKSILLELTNHLRLKIEKFKEKEWKEKEKKLSQKIVSKNTESLPKIKTYYIFLILGFITIKFVNEIKKQNINGKIYGYYDNSLNYLKNEFIYNFADGLNYTYLYKSLPYFFFVLSGILFLYSFIKDFTQNKKKDQKLSFGQLIGKSFHWISGEKLESSSNETISEDEPSNLRFKNFLKNIDDVLIDNNKILLLTIDNTDRLTDEKLKNIWSTVNIFFAENSQGDYLKNVWLIIPYDEEKVLESFKSKESKLSFEIGRGLLEKTFAITFKVPPPIISNWEQFFQNCFEKAFMNIELEYSETEKLYLIKIFEYYEKNITPRKIINYINQLSTYYLQNPQIKLRYSSIFIYTKTVLFEGNINENIINRYKYLGSLDSLFKEDNTLEINLSKIIYGLDKNEDAEEALLHNEIFNSLKNKTSINIKVTEAPSFIGYFYKCFTNYIENHLQSDTRDHVHFDLLTTILSDLEDVYKNKSLDLYKGLWEEYYKQIRSNRFTIFNKTHEGVIKFCSKETSINFLNNTLETIAGSNTNGINGFPKENQITYLNFLKSTDSFLQKNSIISFDQIKIKEQYIYPELFLELLQNDPELFDKIKIICSDGALKSFFESNDFGRKLKFTELNSFKEELHKLKDSHDLSFIAEDINSYWLKNNLIGLEEVNLLIYFSEFLIGIEFDKISSLTLNSIVDIINQSNNDVDLSCAYYLLFTSYNSDLAGRENLSKAMSKFNEVKKNQLTKKFEKNLRLFDSNLSALRLLYEFKDSSSLYLIVNENFNLKTIKRLKHDSFVWILVNYSSLMTSLTEKNILELNKFLNNEVESDTNKLNELLIDIKAIDLEIITKKNDPLNKLLIKLSNNHLKQYVTDRNSLFLDANTKEFKLFFKLLNLDKIEKEVFESLNQSFINLAMSNNPIYNINSLDLVKIKSNLDKSDMKTLTNIYLNRLFNKLNIYILSPEIFDFFEKIGTPQKEKILQNIVSKPEFYNIELIQQVKSQGNSSILEILKKNLEIHCDIELKKLALEKDLI